MEHLKLIKEQLVSQVESQLGNLKDVHTKELGEVIDMIKDLSEAMYYCQIYKEMEEASEKEETRSSNNNYYYTERYYPYMDYYNRDMDKNIYGRMYYPDRGGSMDHTRWSGGSQDNQTDGDRNYYTERDYPVYLHDEREGRSPMKRKMYMESKDMHQDSTKSMKELENYMQDLTSDMMELLEKASPEEKAIVQKKVNTLANKIQNV